MPQWWKNWKYACSNQQPSHPTQTSSQQWSTVSHGKELHGTRDTWKWKVWGKSYPWPSSAPLLPVRQMFSWGLLRVWPAGQGRFSSPSSLPWWGPIWSTVFSSGLPSSRKMRNYRREFSEGLWRWSMRKGWGSWTCLGWRRVGWEGTLEMPLNICRVGVRRTGPDLSVANTRKNVFTLRVTKWDRLPRGVVKSPSLPGRGPV